MSTPQKIRTRFAPSPTGFLHVGTLRTALYEYLFAKHNQGEFLLRIEDTDQTRKIPGAVENLKSILQKFGLQWDNKKIIVQSERLNIYKKFAEILIKEKKAYYCFCSKQKLEQLRKIQQQRGLPPMYDGHCRDLSSKEIQENIKTKKQYVVRFKMLKTGQTEFTDLIRGKVSFDNRLLDDPVILKSDGFPTYHLANTVDDHEMGITHVIRGEEWLPSTPKHILIYQALDWQPPEFAHLPLLLNPDKSKLSKRQGDIAAEDYLKKGYLPEALLNFILLLGWNPKTEKEVFSLEEMIKAFDLEKVNKAGAIFNLQKLDWLNGWYIRQMDLVKLTDLCLPYLPKGVDKTYAQKIVALEKDRIKKLADISEITDYFFKQPKYKTDLLLWQKQSRGGAQKNLEILLEFLQNLPEKKFNQKDLEKEIKKLINQNNLGVGETLWPMRVALSGRKASPGPFEIAEVLGKKETIKRVQKAIN